jgi:hypothetical protein
MLWLALWLKRSILASRDGQYRGPYRSIVREVFSTAPGFKIDLSWSLGCERLDEGYL